jgi:hypothetical protein
VVFDSSLYVGTDDRYLSLLAQLIAKSPSTGADRPAGA